MKFQLSILPVISALSIVMVSPQIHAMGSFDAEEESPPRHSPVILHNDDEDDAALSQTIAAGNNNAAVFALNDNHITGASALMQMGLPLYADNFAAMTALLDAGEPPAVPHHQPNLQEIAAVSALMAAGFGFPNAAMIQTAITLQNAGLPVNTESVHQGDQPLCPAQRTTRHSENSQETGGQSR